MVFIADFKQFLGSLPPQSDGFIPSQARLLLRCEEPLMAFFIRITNYAASLSPAEPSSKHYDPHLLSTALCMTRFPEEVLGEPEEPLRFTLLNSAWKLLRIIDTILTLHHRSEDDTRAGLISESVAEDYMQALNEYQAAWSSVWENHQCSVGY
jgi:hypothetical protein